MTCRELADFILDYLEGTLEPAVSARFAHHLTVCPTCVNYIAAYRDTVALGRAAFEDDERSVAHAGMPESLVSSILSAVRAAGPAA